MYSVDIDTGGTMTDCLVSGDGSLYAIKTDTTAHDYTVSFRECLAESARQLGYDGVAQFLDHVDVIRWSSTITTNVLGERRGSKIGLLVSKGHAEDLYQEGYGSAAQKTSGIWEILNKNHVIELSDTPDAEEVLIAIRELLQDGVRRICVCLKGSYPNNSVERLVKGFVEDHYPDHVIGSIPVLLGSEMARTADDYTRVSYSAINAYTHSHLAQSLFKAEDILKYEEDWVGPLLIGNTSGGVARIGKTKAVDTIESGPAFGTFGGAFFARCYGVDNVLCFDVGGTTTKSSVVGGGTPVFQRGGELLGIPVKTAIPMLRSAVVGGGSVARYEGNGSITLGPDSMGAAPGPACYGLGGNQASLTDALVVLGYMDPTRFLGGRRMLDVEGARAVIEQKLAKPLGSTIEAAALAVRDKAVEIMANLVKSTLQEANLDPKTTMLYAYGGNGPLFAALVADRLQMPAANIFALSPVFSAFGSAIADVVHTYEEGVGADLADPVAADRIVPVIQKMFDAAERDLESEGFSGTGASYALSLEVADEGLAVKSIDLKEITRESVADAIQHIRDHPDLAGPQQTTGQIVVQSVQLTARYGVGAYEPKKDVQTVGSLAKPNTEQLMYFNGKAVSGAIYRWEGLVSGNVVIGPGVVTGENLTCLVPPHWEMVIDEYGNGLLRKQQSGKH